MLGDKILKLRKKQGLSQEQLGEKINVTRQTISNWELNETAPNPEQLKLLSKSLNISIDELLDNEVKSILEEKVSNTEKLASIIIKILKVIGIVFTIFLVIEIIALICFTVFRTNILTNVESSAKTVCMIEDKKYLIEFDNNNYFKCENCSDKINNDLKEIIDFNNIDKSIKNIEQYFKDNNGTCE